MRRASRWLALALPLTRRFWHSGNVQVSRWDAAPSVLLGKMDVNYDQAPRAMRLAGRTVGFTRVLEPPSKQRSIMIRAAEGVIERTRDRDDNVRWAAGTVRNRSVLANSLPVTPPETGPVKRTRKPTLLDVRRAADRAFVSGKMVVLSQEELRTANINAHNHDNEFERRLAARKKEIATLRR
jgi:hypothetical protein